MHRKKIRHENRHRRQTRKRDTLPYEKPKISRRGNLRLITQMS